MPTSRKGATFHLSLPRKREDVTVWERVGSLLMREHGSGGAMYLAYMGVLIRLRESPMDAALNPMVSPTVGAA